MRRAAGLIVVLGFVAASLWSAGAVPLGCCGADCAQCPAAFCKAASHFTALVSPPTLVPLFRIDPKLHRESAVASFRSVDLPGGFTGPMRN